jgi:ankyrin repeat protein
MIFGCSRLGKALRVRAGRRAVRWLVPLCSVCSLAAASADLRLIDAVKHQDKAAVRTLVKQVDVNAAYGDGSTALHWAAHWDDVDTVDLLIQKGARVDIGNDLGVTPLSLACTNRSAQIVTRLLAAGANPNHATSTGETPVMTCARTGNVEAMESLLTHGADVNAAESRHGQTALMWAATYRHAAVVQALIEHGANIQARTRVTEHRVSTGIVAPPAGASGVWMNKGGFTPLLFAARQGDAETGQLLLRAGANVNDADGAGNSALVVASYSDNSEFAALLLEHGADAHSAGAGYTALHTAILRGNLDLMKQLLAHGADPNARITKPTEVRRFTQDFEFSARLVGATPYLLAAKYGEPDMMRALAAAGADTRATMPDGTTALLFAAGSSATGLAGQIWSDRRERTLPSEEAVAAWQHDDSTLRSVQAAVDLGGDVNAANQDGLTAYAAAAGKDLKPVMQYLLEKGANPAEPPAKRRRPPA